LEVVALSRKDIILIFSQDFTEHLRSC